VPGPQGPQGAKGDRGDITVVGDAELQAAVDKLKAQKAAALALIMEKLAVRDTPAAKIAHLHLQAIKRVLEQ
jgi:hypothetical protein